MVYAEPVDLTGKTIIVTGGSPGSLGFETARTVASWGGSVVITSRSDADTVLEALRERLTSATSEHPGLDDGYRVQLFTDAAARSARTGEWVELADVS